MDRRWQEVRVEHRNTRRSRCSHTAWTEALQSRINGQNFSQAWKRVNRRSDSRRLLCYSEVQLERERNSKNGTVDKHTCYSCRENTNWNDGKISTNAQAEIVTAGWTNINTVCNEIDVGFCRQNSFLPRWRKTWASETLLDCYCQC